MKEIKKILFITLSNIGDVILTLPSLDLLKATFAEAAITVLVGPRPQEIFNGNPAIGQVVVYDKKMTWFKKAALFWKLKNERFDMIVDLRNTFMGFILAAPYKTSPFTRIPSGFGHMRDRHLYKIRRLLDRLGRDALRASPRVALAVKDDDRHERDRIMKDSGIARTDRIVVISPGARSHTKRWPSDNFCSLAQLLIDELGVKVVIVGDHCDVAVADDLAGRFKESLLNLTGKTSIKQLAAVIEKANLVITNDSAVSHIASYLNTPVIALFGITDEVRYGPWSDTCVVLKKDIHCRPCRRSQCPRNTLECIRSITVTDCYMKARDILSGSLRASFARTYPFRRILVARTDRIGDVLLSTPVVKCLRDNYPDCFIAMMVAPETASLVRGNPNIDQVIVLDKEEKHRSWQGSMQLAHELRKENFDLALVLHPTVRVHLLAFFAGIQRRVGFDRKFGFLLTDQIRHTKQWGWKHEVEYNLDILRYLGVRVTDKNLFMPTDPAAEAWVEGLFKREGIGVGEKVMAIHPGASCPSKVWPAERFARVSDILSRRHGLRVVLIAGPKDGAVSREVVSNMKQPVIDLSGKTSLLETASILKRCALFISNDSGPVHIASSFGVPVVSIFGRKQAGLSPVRWGPTGRAAFFLHKDAGCIQCLAHNCKRQFLCLRRITVEDVCALAEEALRA
jgi:heptosyltransferase II